MEKIKKKILNKAGKVECDIMNYLISSTSEEIDRFILNKLKEMVKVSSIVLFLSNPKDLNEKQREEVEDIISKFLEGELILGGGVDVESLFKGENKENENKQRKTIRHKYYEQRNSLFNGEE